MKLRDTLTELNEQRTTVVWPVYNPNFETFRSKLRNAISSNFGSESARSMEYCVEAQLFYFNLYVEGLLSGPLATNCHDDDKRTACALRRLVSLNPAESVTSQMKGLSALHTKMQQRHALLQILLDKHLARQQ